ncbi:MAG: ATP-binding protein [Alphaproteobacteria bacterium]|jgi:two-component system nitrogen regulation sensor histidine kinase NtrY|nr:ATP-binding protein [Candidatus Jidaibacter sp.]
MINYLKAIYINSSLRKKIIILISLFVTLTPLTLVSILAFTYYKLGIASAFNEQMAKAISETVYIADLYLKEHKDAIKGDILAIAKDIEHSYYTLATNPEVFGAFLDKQSEVRNLAEIVVFQKEHIIAKNSFSLSFAFEKLPEHALTEAASGDVVILSNTQSDKVQALIKLTSFSQTYLLVGMYVDQSIINHLNESKGSAEEYTYILKDLKSAQMKLTIVFIVLIALISIASILLGKKLAEIITEPLNSLVNATLKLKEGDFSIKLPEQQGKDETAILTRAFNQMTSTLALHRSELIKSREIINERRRFIEKVLAELSAGVITLDSKGKILLMNSSAKTLINVSQDIELTSIKQVLPEAIELIDKAKADHANIVQTNLKLSKDDVVRHLFLKIGTLMDSKNKVETVIITFDDITELVKVQRMAAWGDVARRVAHEIKNPLTPITLAAERIQSKFLKQISEDTDVFKKYIDTIINHSNDIHVIVEEFVEFGRIPEAHIQTADIIKVVKDAIFSQKAVYRDIKFELNASKKSLKAKCDYMQISRVLINLLKNAAESIQQKKLIQENSYTGLITVEIELKDAQTVDIKVCDNGLGIQKEMQDKIFEPYVTTKSHGTGLGLAIVRKILEDHGSVMSFKPLAEGVEFKFSLLLVEKENE